MSNEETIAKILAGEEVLFSAIDGVVTYSQPITQGGAAWVFSCKVPMAENLPDEDDNREHIIELPDGRRGRMHLRGVYESDRMVRFFGIGELSKD